MSQLLPEPGIEDVLTKNNFGHLGCFSDTKPFVFPMAYIYHKNIMYGQTTTGHKVEIARKNQRVCFQVEEVKERSWRSVMCWGSFEELDFSELQDDDSQKITKLLIGKIGLLQQQFGINIPFSFDNTEATPVTVNQKTSTLFRIVIESKEGRWHNW